MIDYDFFKISKKKTIGTRILRMVQINTDFLFCSNLRKSA